MLRCLGGNSAPVVGPRKLPLKEMQCVYAGDLVQLNAYIGWKELEEQLMSFNPLLG